MKTYEIEKFTNDQIKKLGANLSEGNEVIVETAGFIPLEIKLKRFQEAGQLIQFQRSEFTSGDLREMYLSPDFEINPEDDFEDIQDKLEARKQFVSELRKNKTSSVSKGNTEVNSAAKDLTEKQSDDKVKE